MFVITDEFRLNPIGNKVYKTSNSTFFGLFFWVPNHFKVPNDPQKAARNKENFSDEALQSKSPSYWPLDKECPDPISASTLPSLVWQHLKKSEEKTSSCGVGSKKTGKLNLSRVFPCCVFWGPYSWMSWENVAKNVPKMWLKPLEELTLNTNIPCCSWRREAVSHRLEGKGLDLVPTHFEKQKQNWNWIPDVFQTYPAKVYRKLLHQSI